MLSEANNVFKSAQTLSKAARTRSRQDALQAYAKLALAYDRFLKAGDLYSKRSPSSSPPPAAETASGVDATRGLVPRYDALTSTESLYRETPQSALRYSADVPKTTDPVVVIAGPDKGRTGVLLGTQGTEAAIVKLSTREIKVIDLAKIARQT